MICEGKKNFLYLVMTKKAQDIPEEKFGSMGHLTKEQAYWEDLVYSCKELPVDEAMEILKNAFEAKYYRTE